ncbi:UDP-N-acetylmuramoyl-L-alanyl-D-glutamate--2,6-diaminopimelate ligase [Ovoidimarina sediminis]|uniref:UDP-N-acetylmuramoyl-L-alanyl-D-glutamate--2, 6-diaminopimelate ligase n=1 Tax=Ovoidimarina sediminis TaxID=3079856 RepID=UPI00290A699A|nr:UDP-N-acetylmuramoyl-L-alanyl-D-glutamate--2,6-diaminopimelate ligase [Rhodophyticola sp. MJ-SS7]MDU8943088.1 UDP-N-acetylmuramoyl-L-alanyl-D-glutamate--2,6-diaminopimelate ligase [Rhodophyticola sp. MJ-SS7]
MTTRSETKTLSALGLAVPGSNGIEVTGLSVDSRSVRAGEVFAALPGVNAHGARFAADAAKAGAAAILTDRDGARIARGALGEAAIPVIVTEDPRQALAFAAALWFGQQPEAVVAVTGTNGKTSVSAFTRQLWNAMGIEAVNIGTTGVEGSFLAPMLHTTPEPITLHRILAEVAAEGIDHAVMEASSHGLDQRRLDGVRLVAAGFTNFSQDHLDYHETFEAYFAAKAGLFDRVLPEDGTAVVNTDDPMGPEVVAIAEGRGCDILTVGRDNDAALCLIAQRFDVTGQELRFSWNGEARQVRLPLIGGFQAENALVAAGLTIASGCAPSEVFEALPMLTTVRGRMQLAATRDNGAAVFVDYAHTPDALATAIRALRPHVMGRLIVVFGAGGDRDRGKRPLMGEAVAKHADIAIVTDDNPRSEDPAEIRAAILAACPGAREIGDRAEAILRGVDMLEQGDALLIAGKGHETGQTVGDTVYPFDDVEQASVAVAALDGHGA